MNSIQSWPSSFFWKKCWEIAFKQISTEMYKIWRLGLLSRAAMVRGDSTAIECPSRWSSTERRLADLNLWQIIKPFEKEFELYSMTKPNTQIKFWIGWKNMYGWCRNHGKMRGRWRCSIVVETFCIVAEAFVVRFQQIFIIRRNNLELRVAGVLLKKNYWGWVGVTFQEEHTFIKSYSRFQNSMALAENQKN